MIMARRADHREIAELTGRGAGLSRQSTTPTHLVMTDLQHSVLGMLLGEMACFPKERGANVFKGLFMNPLCSPIFEFFGVPLVWVVCVCKLSF